MKILILSQTFPLTPNDSTAHFMYDFAAGFKDLGHQVLVLLPYHKKLRAREFKGLEVCAFKYIWPESLHLLGFGKSLLNDQKLPLFAYLLAPFYFFFGFIALWRLVRRKKIDIINAHWIVPNGFLAACVSKITRVPLVVTLPGSDVYLARKNLFFKILSGFAIKQAKEIVSNSPQLLSDLKVKGKVISYGVPIAEVLIPPSRGSTSHTPGVSLVIATAGRKVEKKGFEFLQSIYPEVEVISGLSIDEFRQKLLSVDIFLAPSVRDSAGNLDDASLVVLEAMAAGCCVIASDLPGYRSIIEDGKTGYLLNPYRKKNWTILIKKLQKSPILCTRIGSAARKKILKNFTPSHIASAYLRLF